MEPTAEQRDVVEAILDPNSGSVGITALAGTGKTTNLMQAAAAIGLKPIQYMVFNKAMATDAGRRSAGMPTMKCSTVHSLAYQAVGWRFRARLNTPRMKASQIAERCGLRRGWDMGGRRLRPATCVWFAQQAVMNYCQTMDPEICAEHVPTRQSWTIEQSLAVAEQAVELARWMWDDICRPDGWEHPGWLPFDHAYYLKMFALMGPVLNCDYLFLDEAQDSDPITVHLVASQLDRCKVVACGDPNQSIYEWRRAIDAMSVLPINTNRYLTQSFRFGEEIAEMVNPILSMLDDSKPPLLGDPSKSTFVCFDEARDARLEGQSAFLSRTNAVMLDRAMSAMDQGLSVHVVGGAARFVNFCYGIMDLQSNPPRPAQHPWLAEFRSWRELLEHCRNPDEEPAADLVGMVNLVCRTRGNAKGMLDYLKRTVPDGSGQLNVGTVHQFKGAEMDNVTLAGDFPTEPEALDAEELRLLYVAMTRAKKRLDVHRALETLSAVRKLTKDEKTTQDAPPPALAVV